MTTRAALALLVVLGAVAPAGGARPGDAAGDSDGRIVRGVSLGLFASDPEWDYTPLLREIRGRGATDVLLVIPLVQQDRHAIDLALRKGRSPSLSTYRRTLRASRDLGLRVGVMPLIEFVDGHPGEWRARLEPSAGVEAFFARYRERLIPLATIAEDDGAVRFVIGSELASLERHEAPFRKLIDAVRRAFTGALVYSVNWDRLDRVPFWDALDAIGVSGYFPLTRDAESRPGREGLARAWREPRSALAALSRRHRRPVLLTEVGYPSVSTALVRPWDHASEASVDLEAQRLGLRAFCDAFAERSVIAGFYVWNWFAIGGPRDRGHSPRGKPAAATLSRCFERRFAAPLFGGTGR